MKRKAQLILAVILLICGTPQASAAPTINDHFSDPVTGQTVAISLPLPARSVAGHDLSILSKSSNPADAVVFDVLERTKTSWALSNPREQLVMLGNETDEEGIKHVRFQQSIKGIPILGTYLFVHVNTNRQTVNVNGKLSPGSLDEVDPRITAEEAFRRAQSRWSERTGEEAEFHHPPKLSVLDISFVEEYVSAPLRLVYEVDLGSKREAFRYLVSATDGSIVKILPLSFDATRRWVYDCSLGTCYRGAYSSEWNYTFGRSEGEGPVGANPIPYPVIQSYPYETDRLYSALAKAHNFYLNKFKRNGANNRGGLGDGVAFTFNTIPALSYVQGIAPSDCPGAKLNGMYALEFCAGMTPIDIVGHEFTHAVIRHSAQLQYQNQSGALNESFADIFGEAIERFGTGSHDWLLGASSLLGIGRSMADPSATFFNPYYGDYRNGQQPDRAYSALFYCGSEDNGGVHQNSGVLNHAAYLMSVGGTFNGCTIRGIGEDKMERIMYRALTKYLGESSNFYAAYQAILSSTQDLYGWGEFLEVRRALKAVELDQAQYCLGSPRVDPGADENGNDVSDCNDPLVTGVVPAKPVLRPGNKRVRITMQYMAGVQYFIQVTIKPLRGKATTTYYLTAARDVMLKGLSKGSAVKVSFRYLLAGQTPLYSSYSAVAKVRIS